MDFFWLYSAAYFIFLGIDVCRHWITFSQVSSRNCSTNLLFSSGLKLGKSTASAPLRIQSHLIFASCYLINLSKGKSGLVLLKFAFSVFFSEVLMHNWLELPHQCSPRISLCLRELSTQMRRAKRSMNINVLAMHLWAGRARLAGWLPDVIIWNMKLL